MGTRNPPLDPRSVWSQQSIWFCKRSSTHRQIRDGITGPKTLSAHGEVRTKPPTHIYPNAVHNRTSSRLIPSIRYIVWSLQREQVFRPRPVLSYHESNVDSSQDQFKGSFSLSRRPLCIYGDPTHALSQLAQMGGSGDKKPVNCESLSQAPIQAAHTCQTEPRSDAFDHSELSFRTPSTFRPLPNSPSGSSCTVDLDAEWRFSRLV